MRMYALLAPKARKRVHDYVSERINDLPVLAAVGGGIEHDEPDLFPHSHDVEDTDNAEQLSPAA